MKVAYLPSLRTKSTETITHTLLAVIHAAVRKFDVVYLCGVGNAALAGILKLAGSRVIVNVGKAQPVTQERGHILIVFSFDAID